MIMGAVQHQSPAKCFLPPDEFAAARRQKKKKKKQKLGLFSTNTPPSPDNALEHDYVKHNHELPVRKLAALPYATLFLSPRNTKNKGLNSSTQPPCHFVKKLAIPDKNLSEFPNEVTTQDAPVVAI